MQLKINLNDKVKVKLTAFGEAILAQHMLKVYRELGGVLDARDNLNPYEEAACSIFFAYPYDEDRYRTFKLYELFEIFGHTISPSTVNNPFFSCSFYYYEPHAVAV